jgi:membrane fusion protein (multidrug efflux system)
MSENENIQRKDKRAFIRHVLMFGGIAILAAACAWLYLVSGRYIATDNAYIKAAKILVPPQVAGTIVSVSVKDNQPVKAGDTILLIDPAPYKIAIDKARADMAVSYAQIEQLKAQYRQKQEDIARAQIEADFAVKEYGRKNPLATKGAISQASLDEARRQRDAAKKDVAILQEEINGISAALADDPDIKPEDHPLYQKALAALHDAELNLERTKILAPADGIIGTAPHIGDYARAGIPLFNLIATNDVWIEANYKETELTNVKIGQPVSIEIDTYPGHEWHGHVESISPATGSEFSVLPAQNATGNWVKVVQRIAVRIAVEAGPDDLPLRTGMSTHVSIDTGHYPHGLNRES